MGEVYRAEDLSLRRHVAIKVLPSRLAGRPEALERFEREASAVGALNHPNIVTIHSIEEIEGQRLITMELVEGETLHTLVPEDGLQVERCLDLAIPLTAAVAAAHQRGVTHRDIKPANIMVAGEDMVKVVDFGLAKLRQVFDEDDMILSRGAADPTLTREGQVLGTVPYMAPEQFRGLPADHRSDVFALGVVLYEMMTGRHPFPGDTQPLVISSILRDPPRPPDEMRADLPPGLRAIAERCLEKAPDDRYQDATALHRDLVALKQSLDSDAIIRSVRVEESAVPWRAIVTVGAVLIALVVGGWLLSGTGPSPVDADRSAPAGGVSPVTAATVDLPKLAVMHFWNTTRNRELEWLRDGLPDMLITDLSQSRAIQVVGADQIYSVLDDLEALELDRRPGAALARDVGARTGAQLVLSGGFTRLGERIRIDLHVHDARSGETLESLSREGTGEDSIFRLIDELSRSVRGTYGDAQIADASSGDRGLEDVTTSSIDAYRLFVEGSKLHRQIKLAEAKSLYEEAIKLDPGFAMAYARLIAVSVNRANFADAKRYAELAFAHADRLPESEKAYIEAEYYSARRATYPRAIAAYQSTIERFPEHFAARRSLGHLYGFIERYEDAIEQYQPIFAADAQLPGIPNALVHMNAALDRFDACQEVLDKEVARHGDEWTAHLLKGVTMLDWGRLDESLEALERSEELRPGDPFVRYTKWRWLVIEGDYDAAKEVTTSLLASEQPTLRFQGHLQRAMASLYVGDLESALADLEAAIENSSGGNLRAVAMNWIADLSLMFDDAGVGLRMARNAQEEAPDDWPGWEGIYWEALAHQALGDEAAADEAASRFAAKAPDDDGLSIVERRYAAHLEAQLQLARGDLVAARAAIDRAVGLLPPRAIHWDWVRYPDHVMIWETEARLAEAEGDDDGALRQYRRIADALIDRHEDPVRWVRSLFQVGRLSAAEGDAARARGYYRRFVDTWGEGDLDPDALRAADRYLAGGG